MRKIKKTVLGFESLENKWALSSVSVVSTPSHRTEAEAATAQVAVQQRTQQVRLVLNVPRFVGTHRGAGSLGGISVSGNERQPLIVAVCTGRGGTVTSAITDPSVLVRSMRNSSGGTNLYIAGSPSAINRNMKFLTYRGNETRINVGLFVCSATHSTKYADVYVPIRRF